MGGGVDITHGGIVAMDPDELRGIGARVCRDAATVQLAHEDLLAIPALVQQTTVGALPALWTAADLLGRTNAALSELASTIGTMADVYELAELRAQDAMLRATDPALAKANQHRIEELLGRNLQLAAEEERLRAEWRRRVSEGFVPQSGSSSVEEAALLALNALSPQAYATLLVLGFGGRGLMGALAAQHGVASRAPLAPTPGIAVVGGAKSSDALLRPGDVRVKKAETRGAPGAAPTSLSEAVDRVPDKGPQVRVEKYQLADGTTRFVAYVDGTRSTSLDGTDSEPWDMASNREAYLEHAESDSYKATVAALRDAGADASTPVDLVGYSQGGMITDLVAQSGEFNVQGVFTIGSPIEPQLPTDVLDVAVRHTDDLVAGLAGGGSAGGTGSPESLVITRTAAPGHGIDPDLPAHARTAYEATVSLAEQSGDPRMDAIGRHFAAYDGAKLETSTDYTATRVREVSGRGDVSSRGGSGPDAVGAGAR